MLEAVLGTLFDWIIQGLTKLGYWGIFWGMAIESACVPVPSEIILPFGGYLSSQGHLPFWSAVAAGTLGGLLGSLIAYWVGALGGRPFLERFGRYFFIGGRELDHADRFFARYGEVAVCVSRLIPGIRTFISLPAGVVGMPLGKFLVYSFIGMVPWSVTLTYAGLKLGQNWATVRGWFHGLDYAIVFLLLAAAGLFVWYQLRERRA